MNAQANAYRMDGQKNEQKHESIECIYTRNGWARELAFILDLRGEAAREGLVGQDLAAARCRVSGSVGQGFGNHRACPGFWA